MNTNDNNTEANESSYDFTRSMEQMLNKSANDFISTASLGLLTLAKYTEKVISTLTSEKVLNVITSLIEVVNSISLPEISEEKKKELLLSYSTWGQFGWTMPDSAPIDLFDNPPKSLTDANRIALQFCKKDDIEAVFDKLYTMSHIRKADISEAKFCFDNRKYKSCTMLLFAIIDARLIRILKKRTNEKTRPGGKKALDRIIDYINNNYDDKKRLMLSLRLANLQACFTTMFSGGNDFKKQPSIINRNFVDHGMLWSSVKRTDCIKVILLLYETMCILETFNIKKVP